MYRAQLTVMSSVCSHSLFLLFPSRLPAGAGRSCLLPCITTPCRRCQKTKRRSTLPPLCYTITAYSFPAWVNTPPLTLRLEAGASSDLCVFAER
ncbi:hypothetical protein GS8_2407 [Geobacillus stearothermophilus]|uniref:Uncharacterized protein n=1 Tax=Geobacillus stearothermophilus TaxID=1422 RepID=A0A150NBY7_GEOSE|nr:hypothetical protein GS8_2407 [Geobacillus stearothermophilus]KYD23285.1 hypothetical protein B4109_2253 [Geobacillus stearothermophilus]KYD34191.1 hypothetical protein B4114_2295 [Geobacillus stearothermophilus]